MKNSKRILLAVAVGIAASAGLASVAFTTIIPGGGPPKSDCYAVLDVAGTKAAKNAKVLECEDGDPSCDQDGTCNDSCTFSVRRCINQTGLTSCTPPGTIDTYKGSNPKSATLVPDPSPLTGSTCGAFTNETVAVKVGKKKKPGSVRFGASAKAPKGTKPRPDGDSYVLKCLPNVTTSFCGGTTTTTMPTATCPTNPQGGPDVLELVVTAGSDLDNGWTGVSHNFPVPVGTTFKFCLSGCDETTTPTCTGTGGTGNDTLNGPDFGPPLPLVAGGVPVCIVNGYKNASINGTANIQTGEITSTINLNTEVWTSSSSNRVCPSCSGATVGAAGTCDSGTHKNQACHTEGIVTVNSDNPPINGVVYTLSHDCPPGDLAHEKVATLPINLDPLTTGQTSLTGPKPCGATLDDSCGTAACVSTCPGTPPLKGGLDQFCCANGPQTPCFPTKTTSSTSGMLIRNGQLEGVTPAWPETTYPKTGVGGASGEQLANVFCIPRTNSTIDGVSGLPGPGALILPVKQCYRKNNQSCP